MRYVAIVLYIIWAAASINDARDKESFLDCTDSTRIFMYLHAIVIGAAIVMGIVFLFYNFW